MEPNPIYALTFKLVCGEYKNVILFPGAIAESNKSDELLLTLFTDG